MGTIVLWIVMGCAVLGALAAIRDPNRGLGREFMQGLESIGPIFLPVAGIMASIPFLMMGIKGLFGPIFGLVGADPAMAATTFIAVDMGGYQLAKELANPIDAQSTGNWIMAMIVGYMAGATIIFSIPVGLAMLEQRDQKYMALGIMSGILSIPIGVATSSIMIALQMPLVRGEISTADPASAELLLTFPQLVFNLVPLILFVVLLALGLRFIPDAMIRIFMIFGRGLDAAIKLVLVATIVETFTGVFSATIGWWGFNPIIEHDGELDALEIAGYIGLMLTGAFPMVYLIQKFLARPMESIGKRLGLEGAGAAGLLATLANILAMFRLVKDMRPKDKVLNIAFAVCAAFMFGDHLAFTVNFQPTLVSPILLGKLVGGCCGFALAYWLSVPKTIELEQLDNAEQTRKSDESVDAEPPTIAKVMDSSNPTES